jgi:hypothetical protein
MAIQNTERRLTFKLKNLLEQDAVPGRKSSSEPNKLTAYRLEIELRGKISRSVIYAWAKLDAPPEKLDTRALTALLECLERLLNRSVALSEVLDYEDAPPPQQIMSRRTGR